MRFVVPNSRFDGKIALEIVSDPANGLDGGVLSLPLLVGAVVSSLHDVHVAMVVWLLIQHPADWRANENQNVSKSAKCIGGQITKPSIYVIFIYLI